MNVLLILLLSLVFKTGLVPDDDRNLATISLAFLMLLQISALLLNLIPVPPLDGFQAIAPWLHYETRERLFAASNQGLFIVFAALWFIKPLNLAFWELVHNLSQFLGVDPYLGYMGLKAFRFWQH
jgi:Zn-dependent protease